MQASRGDLHRSALAVRAIPAPKRRSGSITVELLLNLPIWMLLVLAVAQFGELSCKMQYVSLASRVGADAAAETPALPDSGGVPAGIVDAVQRQLAASHMACSRILLEHNLGKTPVALVTGNGAGLPAHPPLAPGRYVRLTVFVRPDAILPNFLGAVGVELWSRALVQSTTVRYRLPTAGRQP